MSAKLGDFFERLKDDEAMKASPIIQESLKEMVTLHREHLLGRKTEDELNNGVAGIVDRCADKLGKAGIEVEGFDTQMLMDILETNAQSQARKASRQRIKEA